MVKWPKETSGYANTVGDAFKSNLKSVAETFAKHERVDQVSKKHVDESFAALSRLGLHSKRWWQRSDTWTAFGAFLFAISFSVPDVCSAFCSFLGINQDRTNVVSVSLLIVFALAGIALFFWAMHRGSLPKKPGAA